MVQQYMVPDDETNRKMIFMGAVAMKNDSKKSPFLVFLYPPAELAELPIDQVTDNIIYCTVEELSKYATDWLCDNIYNNRVETYDPEFQADPVSLLQDSITHANLKLILYDCDRLMP